MGRNTHVLYNEGMFTKKKIRFVYPTTYLVSKTGEILAVRKGILQWDSAEARTLITALMDDEFSGSASPPDPVVHPEP